MFPKVVRGEAGGRFAARGPPARMRPALYSTIESGGGVRPAYSLGVRPKTSARARGPCYEEGCGAISRPQHDRRPPGRGNAPLSGGRVGPRPKTALSGGLAGTLAFQLLTKTAGARFHFALGGVVRPRVVRPRDLRPGGARRGVLHRIGRPRGAGTRTAPPSGRAFWPSARR